MSKAISGGGTTTTTYYAHDGFGQLAAEYVNVDLQIDNDGKVLNARATTGPERLRPWAPAAALKWRFEGSMPGTAHVVFAFVLQKGLTDPPAITSVFTSPNRVVVLAEKRDLVIIADPPLENMGKQKRPKH